MKAKHWLQAGALVIFACGLVFLMLSARENDPVYQGIPLSQHLESCHVDGIHHGGGTRGSMLEEPPEPRLGDVTLGSAREAILHEGTNALPMLVRMLTGGYRPRDRWLRPMVTYLGLPQRFLWTNSTASWLDLTRALAAFHTLGSNAAPAAPRIIPLLREPDTALQAIVALMLICPDREKYILSLTNVARIRKPAQTGATRDMLLSVALLALGSFGPKASNAIPFLVGSLSSTNDRVQAAAAVALARVGAPAEHVVPLIVRSLPKTDPTPPPNVRPRFIGPDSVPETLMKIWALEQFGPKARDALPMLSTIEKYRTVNFRVAAKKAAARIKGER